MKRLFALFCLCALSCCLSAQVVDTTVCEILKNPVAFNGKTVKIKGTVEAGFTQFVVKGVGCGQKVNDIWLDYPEGTKAKAGPAAVLELQPARNFAGVVAPAEPRAAVTLEKSKDFKQFDSLLTAPFKGDGLCLGCVRYTVTATLVGRLDGVKTGLVIDKGGKIASINGFGNLNAYNARLVLQSVSDVASQEIDYSKSAAATKGDKSGESNGTGPIHPVSGEMHLERVGDTSITDPVGEAHNSAAAFPAGSPLGEKLERAASAFPKKGEENGVFLTFTNPNQAIAKDEGKADHDSPDGILYNCKMNMDRLKGPSTVLVVAYAGNIIADLRDPQKTSTYEGTYDFDYYGLQSTALGAIGSRLKTLTLPGGYLIWNKAWAPTEIDSSMVNSMKGYLDNEELLKR